MSDDSTKADAAAVASTTVSGDVSRDPHRIQADATMIASNIDASDRVAPGLGKMSIIDDMYAFAARLRASSTGD